MTDRRQRATAKSTAQPSPTDSYEAICCGGSSSPAAHHQLAVHPAPCGERDYEGYEIWSTAGSITLPAGSEFAIATHLEGFTNFYDAPTDLLSQKFTLEMNVDAARGGEWITFTDFYPGDLAEGAWIDSNGTPLDTPCTHEPCVPMAACFNNWPQPTGMPTESRPTFTPAPEPYSTVAP